MTVRAALAIARVVLGPGKAARFDARLLLAAIARKDAAWLFAHDDEPLDSEVAQRFRAALKRRAHGEPVAYILGEMVFFGRTFAVGPAVLVPRPESELLVALALSALRPRAAAGAAIRICDVGTGSGALAVTLAAELPSAELVAIDLSPAALACAQHNARAHGVLARIRFVLADTLSARAPQERFAYIVANLPYVRSRDLRAAPDPTSFEPRLALDGGHDGLDAYRSLLLQAPAALEPGGTLLMEAGPDTANELAALSANTFAGGARTRVVRDYAGLERMVLVITSGEGRVL